MAIVFFSLFHHRMYQLGGDGLGDVSTPSALEKPAFPNQSLHDRVGHLSGHDHPDVSIPGKAAGAHAFDSRLAKG